VERLLEHLPSTGEDNAFRFICTSFICRCELGASYNSLVIQHPRIYHHRSGVFSEITLTSIGASS
jgi:hypothetical protein